MQGERNIASTSAVIIPFFVSFITAIEFMQAVQIGRTKFDQLVAQNQVKIIKKKRKIYLPVGEIERYFTTNASP